MSQVVERKLTAHLNIFLLQIDFYEWHSVSFVICQFPLYILNAMDFLKKLQMQLQLIHLAWIYIERNCREYVVE